jgi:hypothetical protein
MRPARPKPKDAALLGVGLDNDDGHKRLTRGENFVLVGGSEKTHSVMQETAVKINEHLDREGKRLAEADPGQLREICRRVAEQAE